MRAKAPTPIWQALQQCHQVQAHATPEHSECRNLKLAASMIGSWNTRPGYAMLLRVLPSIRRLPPISISTMINICKMLPCKWG
eukprot:superscaffoldBa00002161_g13394